MKSYRADAARRKMRDILTAVERGEHVQLQRYDTPTAIVVSTRWFHRALAALDEPAPTFEPAADRIEKGGASDALD